MAPEALGDSKIMDGQITLWQVVAAYVFAFAGGSISTSLHLAHKPLCALISFAAGTLLGVTLFAILPESLGDSAWWAVALAAATGYALYFFLAKVSTFWLGLIMAHVGGGFFYLAVHAVLGELIKHGKALVLTSFSAGLALIGILNICLRMLAP